jgi:hypothetical protein
MLFEATLWGFGRNIHNTQNKLRAQHEPNIFTAVCLKFYVSLYIYVFIVVRPNNLVRSTTAVFHPNVSFILSLFRHHHPSLCLYLFSLSFLGDFATAIYLRCCPVMMGLCQQLVELTSFAILSIWRGTCNVWRRHSSIQNVSTICTNPIHVDLQGGFHGWQNGSP